MIIKYLVLAFVVAPLIWIFWLHIKHYLTQGKREFVNQLSGFRFQSFEELATYYGKHHGLRFCLDGPFDPNRFGNLQKTLQQIDRAAQKHVKEYELGSLTPQISQKKRFASWRSKTS